MSRWKNEKEAGIAHFFKKESVRRYQSSASFDFQSVHVSPSIPFATFHFLSKKFSSFKLMQQQNTGKQFKWLFDRFHFLSKKFSSFRLMQQQNTGKQFKWLFATFHFLSKKFSSFKLMQQQNTGKQFKWLFDRFHLSLFYRKFVLYSKLF